MTQPLEANDCDMARQGLFGAQQLTKLHMKFEAGLQSHNFLVPQQTTVTLNVQILTYFNCVLTEYKI